MLELRPRTPTPLNERSRRPNVYIDVGHHYMSPGVSVAHGRFREEIICRAVLERIKEIFTAYPFGDLVSVIDGAVDVRPLPRRIYVSSRWHDVKHGTRAAQIAQIRARNDEVRITSRETPIHYLISLHLNAAQSESHDRSMMIYSDGEQAGRRFARLLSAACADEYGQPCDVLSDIEVRNVRLGILTRSGIRAAVIAEPWFLTNTTRIDNLSSGYEGEVERYARFIVDAIGGLTL